MGEGTGDEKSNDGKKQYLVEVCICIEVQVYVYIQRREGTTEHSSVRMAGVKTRSKQLPAKAIGHCERTTRLRVNDPWEHCVECDGPAHI